MKKMLALILAMLTAASLAACGEQSAPAEPAPAPEAAEEQSEPVNAGNLMLYQYDKDNMDVDFEDEDESYTVEELENYGEVTMITENGMTFYAVDDDGWVTYYISKEDYQDRLTAVEVTLDNFDEYFEPVQEEIWNDDSVEFHNYYRLKDEYLFAMVDYDHLYANTADATGILVS